MEGPSKRLGKDKVFCSQCKYFDDNPGDKGCLNPYNRNYDSDTWYEPSREGKRHPRDINKNNDCPWFLKPPPDYKDMFHINNKD